MKAIMVMFDTLNRRMLPPYGCDWTHTPNFRRLAQRTVTFDNAYICSMPCMPARREMHTGRPNFLHRGWGPLEPFDDSMPRILRENGVYSHLVTDHYHYFEDGGATYHTKYSTWDFIRGQEGDPWIGQVKPSPEPDCVVNLNARIWKQDLINREFMRSEELQPQPQTFAAGMDFIRRNKDDDRWFLQIETFDPHEPFFTQRKYKDLYAEHYEKYKGRRFDWPPYRPVQETPEEIEHLQFEYASLLSMCDSYLGDVLDLMDELDMWKDTMLIVCTDHGFLLGEHDCWAKVWCPWYQENAHVPLFIWDPRSGKAGERRSSLVQTIDFAPTLLEFFDLPRTPDMLGKPLRETIASDQPVRDAALFGSFGGHVNVTDGHYVYMRGTSAAYTDPIHEYTMMPNHMAAPFSVDELRTIDVAEPFSFTKECRTMKIQARHRFGGRQLQTHLFDVVNDPTQQNPLQDTAVEQQMIDHLNRLMEECDAPAEQWERLGLTPPASAKR